MAEDETLDQHMINDTLEGVDWEFEEKADAYAKVMNSLEGNVAAIDKEIERLSQHKREFPITSKESNTIWSAQCSYRKDKIQDRAV